MDLAGKIAVISGGGGGIGAGMGEAFVEKGMSVILADLELDYARAEASRLGERVTALALDVTRLDSWAALREAALERFGRVDILCNNAGVSTSWTPVDQFAPEEFEQVMAINLRGVFYGVQTFAPDMRARGSGHIVNTSSMNGLSPYRGLGAYSASKFAVFGLSDALRDELAPDGVGVSTLFPGLVRSRMSLSRISGVQGAGLSREALEALEARMMDPHDVGRAVVRAIETNAPYIITHPEHKAHFEMRCQALLKAFDAAGAV